MMRPRTFEDLERMVLAELLSNEFALAIADTTPQPTGLETRDFSVPLHGWAFEELRNVQQRPEEFEAMYRKATTILVVAERIAAKGKAFLGHDAAPAHEYTNRLTDMVRKAHRYDGDFAVAFPRHLRELRAIAYQRHLRSGAA